MTNRRLIQQQIDDYEKVFGEYQDVTSEYNAQVDAYNKSVKDKTVTGIGYYRPGIANRVYLADGSSIVQMDHGYRVGMVYGPAVGPHPGNEPPAPDKKAPSFTNKQIAEYQNPQPTYADSAKVDGKTTADKYTGIDDWRSGITTDKGILQRVLQGAYK